MTMLIKNGTVVTATDMIPADVLVDGERIQAVGSGLADTGTGAGADTLQAVNYRRSSGGLTDLSDIRPGETLRGCGKTIQRT